MEILHCHCGKTTSSCVCEKCSSVTYKGIEEGKCSRLQAEGGTVQACRGAVVPKCLDCAKREEEEALKKLTESLSKKQKEMFKNWKILSRVTRHTEENY